MSGIAKKLMQAAAGAEPAPTGSYIALGCAGNIRLLDHTTPGSLSLAAAYTVAGDSFVSWSPQSDYLLVGAQTQTGLVLDHTPLGALSYSDLYSFNRSYAVSWSPKGNYLALQTYLTSTTERVMLFAVSSGQISQPSSQAYGLTYIRGLAFSNSGNYLGVAHGNGLSLYSVSGGSLSLATTYAATGTKMSVSFTPDDNYVAFGDGNNVTLLNHTTPGSLSFSASYNLGATCQGISFDETGSYLGATRKSGTSGFTLLRHTTPGSLSRVTGYNLPNDGADVSFSKDGAYVAVAYNKGFETHSLTLFSRPSPSSISYAAKHDVTGSQRGTSVEFSSI